MFEVLECEIRTLKNLKGILTAIIYIQCDIASKGYMDMGVVTCKFNNSYFRSNRNL